MSHSNESEISYALGRIEALLQVQGDATVRVENQLSSLSGKVEARIGKLEDRVNILEKEGAKTGVWSGILSSAVVAGIIEAIRHAR